MTLNLTLTMQYAFETFHVGLLWLLYGTSLEYGL